MELGLNPDRQTVRPRDCLITEIPPIHQGNQTVRGYQSTNTPTLAVGLLVMVPLLRFCALGSGVDFAAGRANKVLVMGLYFRRGANQIHFIVGIRLSSWDRISVGC